MPKIIPDYYSILKTKSDASSDDIRKAYLKQSLKYHPDRNPKDSSARWKFQLVNDAYTILSDNSRRKSYDISCKNSKIVNPLNMSEKDGKKFYQSYQPESNSEQVFSDEFEDLIAEELGQNRFSYFWQPLGAVSGVCLGFIVANIPGAIAGYAAGSWMGKIRDKKGMSVLDFYKNLPLDRKTELLKSLALKILESSTGY